MHLYTGEKRERVQAFDTIIEKNAQALARPNVVHVLGAYAASLGEINAQLFMPNIRGRELKLPKRHRMDNHAALLPLLPSDPTKGLHITPSLFLPGKEQLDRTQQRILSGPVGLSESQARQAVVTAMMYFRADKAQATLDEHLREVTEKKRASLFPTSATIGNYTIMQDEQEILYGRQTIVMPSELATFSTPAVASIGLHEELHVVDNNNMRFEDVSDDAFGMRKELRGYHVGALLLGCMADEILEADSPVTETTLLVETIRQRSKRGTNEPPFAVNDAIAAFFGANE